MLGAGVLQFKVTNTSKEMAHIGGPSTQTKLLQLRAQGLFINDTSSWLALLFHYE